MKESLSSRNLTLAAYCLHGWYTALESLLERCATTLDQAVPSGSRCLAEFVPQAMADVPDLRPAILDTELRTDLLALLSFRHLPRDACGVQLEPARVEQETRRLLRIAPPTDAAIRRSTASSRRRSRRWPQARLRSRRGSRSWLAEVPPCRREPC